MERVAWPGPAAAPPYEPLGEQPGPERTGPSTVVLLEAPRQPPPRDHLAWSLCSALYANVCCLGFLALVFSIKSRDRKLLGDYSGARSYGSTAKYLNITTQLLNFSLTILVIILIVTGVIVVGEPLPLRWGPWPVLALAGPHPSLCPTGVHRDVPSLLQAVGSPS
ncbi:LOW QUALITY PROTEIN: dispanin subfamily A member 2b-like [Phaenicophaeus curvirostris]|uniref:LOW QUALITY PROTEIN: dispanin subfamily A member 2b-like n=1 Tax=Phaenicophaeus curvirostris TaxID=33595 RepID=UPI0037F0ECBC